ncbi:hypothetical protein K402DRAFT_460657 [Aulographum hederae CBS 113979]|uniref:Las1-domain-containing protein n=1 Tax=Aulographum hederae CBS 113979 TaxID=1176131 RepID=A0A6G1H9M6_9PEZI|nr:hypothetical protein K402DRAFT_460657 [Aulographum hederae CBS 113979]
MHLTGELLSFPQTWVEVRHEITHGLLPSLKTLETLVSKALDWLRERYFSGVRAVLKRRPRRRDREAVGREVAAVLKMYLADRKGEIKRGGDTEGSRAGLDAYNACERICGRSANAQMLVARVMLPMMLPANRRLGDNMTGAHTIWDPLLKRLATFQTHFLRVTIALMLQAILRPLSPLAPTEADREAVFTWLCHILFSDTWFPQRQVRALVIQDMEQKILKMCVGYPGRWSDALYKEMRENGVKCSELWDKLLSPVASVDDREEGDERGNGMEFHPITLSMETALELPDAPTGLKQDAASWMESRGVARQKPVGLV